LKTTLLIPTLNEAAGLEAVLPKIRREWIDQILVVDGMSTDGTAELARREGLEVVVQKEKGLWHAYREALPHVRGDVVVTFSPDGNCLPELIPALLEKMKEGYDMVVVSRYLPPAKSEDDDRLTGFGNWMFTTLINRLHGGRYTDAMGIFRAWRRELFESLDLHKPETYAVEKICLTRIGVEPILSVRCAKRKLRIAEIPGDEPARIGGIRKLQIVRWGAAYLLQVLRETVYWR
jgi:glycosyltransferase involved in cell wall biosynthesis